MTHHFFDFVLYIYTSNDNNNQYLKYHQDNNALFLVKTLKLLFTVPINSQKQLWLKKSEVSYSEYIVWKLFKIVTKFTNNDSLCFQIDEYKLESIKHEIHRCGDERPH